MLTTARPILEHVPASFLDPVSLADQQAQGVVSLIVVRYPADPGPPGDGHEGPQTGPLDALGPTYDTFVAASGQLLAVARTTTDYRFPVMPATALERFIEHRDGGCPVFLSVYELDEPDCARFLETVFYSECLKLHVDGADSAALVAQQIARSSCGGGLPSGILEVNDFSDPLAPRVRLIDLDDLATVDPDDRTDIGSLADELVEHLDGVRGRVLLYDRTKNRAAMPDRTDRAFDLDGIIEQANRLADARRGTGTAGGPSGDAAVIAQGVGGRQPNCVRAPPTPRPTSRARASRATSATAPTDRVWSSRAIHTRRAWECSWPSCRERARWPRQPRRAACR